MTESCQVQTARLPLRGRGDAFCGARLGNRERNFERPVRNAGAQRLRPADELPARRAAVRAGMGCWRSIPRAADCGCCSAAERCRAWRRIHRRSATRAAPAATSHSFFGVSVKVMSARPAETSRKLVSDRAHGRIVKSPFSNCFHSPRFTSLRLARISAPGEGVRWLGAAGLPL